ncbi:hypothetical protein Cni_G20595 [Canna indica]|uniref:SANT domain-containing protein n=1 Tax=Canna indica TaxID=4628 RepID=A0AAQ3KTG2_9LILI|nr:hypothetical protein Cni_G20595 [Canna indica]
MDAAQMDCLEEQIAEKYAADQLHSPATPDRNGNFDEPLIYTRIGDEYQVEIPLVATDLDCCELKPHLSKSSKILEVDHHVLIELSSPIMWVQHEGGHTRVDQDLANHSEERDGSESMDSTVLEDKTSTSTTDPQQLNEHKSYSPLPDSPFSSWSDDDKQSFLLGLYVFEKDLVQVKEFIECKKMGDILSYYYGKFYRSDAYLRWSELRKAKKRRILGHRIFTGRRQKELLSRVLPKVPKDAHDTILKAVKTLNVAKNCLQEFVSTLKKTIGMEALVEVIGIGKGEHDLTSIQDPIRSNQSISTCPEIPVGKACALLSTQEIIEILTGDLRLSKAKASDLFWEAIWPRLLARGWHSEQPIASKNSLVFIIPGIKKFSRKRHMKGHHYFDSVSDILNKVSLDCRLLELETAESSNVRDENGCVMDTKTVQNGPFDHQHHSYLRPSVRIGNSGHMKFTIVDTSLGQGEEPFKMRELMSLPSDAFSKYNLITITGEVGSDSSEYSDDSSSEDQGHSDPDTSDNTELKITNKEIIGSTEHCTSENALTLTSKTLPINGHISDDQFFVQDADSHLNSRAKSERESYLAPVAKRKRLTAYKHERTGRGNYSFLKRHQGIIDMEEGAQPKLGGKEGSQVTESNPCHRDVQFNIPTSASTDKVDNSASKEESCSTTAIAEATFSNETSQSQTLIDLNLPPNSPVDSQIGEHLNSELVGSQHDLNESTVSLPETNQQHEKITETNGHQLSSSINSRRQSTRRRPPTIRALESIACGFLQTKRRRRATTAS